jgi:hypothetical protein
MRSENDPRAEPDPMRTGPMPMDIANFPIANLMHNIGMFKVPDLLPHPVDLGGDAIKAL